MGQDSTELETLWVLEETLAKLNQIKDMIEFEFLPSQIRCNTACELMVENFGAIAHEFGTP